MRLANNVKHLRLDRVIRSREFSQIDGAVSTTGTLHDRSGDLEPSHDPTAYALHCCTHLKVLKLTHKVPVASLTAVAVPMERKSFSQASVVGCASLQVIGRRSPQMSPAILGNAGEMRQNSSRAKRPGRNGATSIETWSRIMMLSCQNFSSLTGR